MKRGFKAEAERKSIQLRKDMNLKYTDKLCGFELAQFLDVTIKTPSEIIGLEPYRLHNLLHNGKSEFSAVVLPSGKDSFWIIHNPTHTAERQQSNICHELAHIICGHEFSSEDIQDLPLPLRDFNKLHEDEAIYLGGCLQLPRKALSWAINKGMSKDDISSYYEASPEMVRYRINITGLNRIYARL